MTRFASLVRPGLPAVLGGLIVGAILLVAPVRAEHTEAGRGAAVAANAQPLAVRLLVIAPDDEAANGTSMGLTEARRTAELLGNRVDATSVRVAAGSTVAATAASLLVRGKFDILIGGATSPECLAMTKLARDARIVYVNAWCDDDALRGATPARCDGGRRVLRALHVAPSARMREGAIAAAAGAPDAARDHKAVAWHPSLERYGAGQVNDRYRLAFRRGMTERAWLGWAAVKLGTEIALRPGAGNIGAALLQPRALDGHKGRALRIRASDGQLLQPLYVIAAGTDSSATASVLAEIANPLASDSSSRGGVSEKVCG